MFMHIPTYDSSNACLVNTKGELYDAVKNAWIEIKLIAI